MTSKSPIRTVSLFSGCGGLDLGFHQAGYCITNAFDLNPIVVKTYNHNIQPNAKVLDLSAHKPAGLGRVDVLLAGSPCQGFSVAGRRDFADPRNSLLIRTAELALSIKPKILLAENVPGALSGKHKLYWEDFEQRLKGGGYNLVRFTANASDFGAAQLRKRVFLVAWRGTRTFNPAFPDNPAKKLSDVLAGIPPEIKNHEITPLSQDSLDYKIARRITPGKKLTNVRDGETAIHTWDIPEVFGKTTKQEQALLSRLIRLRRQHRVRDHGDADPVPLALLEKEFGVSANNIVHKLLSKGYLELHEDHVDLTHTFNGKYKRLHWDQPSYTVDTYFGNPRYFLHPEEHRGFTAREAARIQGFPDEFEFLGSRQQNMEMIGNAVSPLVAYNLAIMVRKGLLA